MYRKKRGNETLRINQFKGLNNSGDPKNIEDAELYDMMNLYLGKDGTLNSRLGWTKKCSDIAGSTNIRGVYKTYWEDVGTRLYAMGSTFLYKINESSWASTAISSTMGGSEHVQFDRYKDKLLFLCPGKPIAYIKSDDSFNLLEYPRPQAALGASAYLAASAGGSLDENSYYQYTISLVLGEDYKDGETIGALPSDPYTIEPFPGMIIHYWGGYPYEKTTTANKTIAATDQPFSCDMKGFDIGYVNLYRRKATLVGEEFLADPTEPWALIDSAFIHKTYNGADWVYEFEANSMTGYDENGDGVGVITDITGTWDSTTDIATIYVDFTDNGTVDADVGYSPRDTSSEATLYPKYMTRLNNRLLVANITNDTQESGKKKVYFSYRGYTPLGNDENIITEIPNFMYPDPMLIFPPANFFYCDKDDVADEITGITTFQDNVIIFTNHKTFLWREGLIDPIKLSDSVGCVANDTIREFEGKLVWLAKNGVYQWGGDKIENISQDKIQYHIDSITTSLAYKATAEVYKRRYFLAAPFLGLTANRIVMVYDFDLKEWYPYRYRYYNGVDTTYWLNIEYLFNYQRGANEALLAGEYYGSGSCSVAQLEYGYSDTYSCAIPISLRTKMFDLKAPDIEKELRNAFIQATNVGSGGLSLAVYVDQIDSVDDTIAIDRPQEGLLLAGSDSVDEATVGASYIVGASPSTDSAILINFSDTAAAVSLGQGLTGFAFQFGLSADVISAPLKIKALGIDWRARRKATRTIGG